MAGVTATASAGVTVGSVAKGGLGASSSGSSTAALTPQQKASINSSVGKQLDIAFSADLLAVVGTKLSLTELGRLQSSITGGVRAKLGSELGLSGSVGAGAGATVAVSGAKSLGAAIGTRAGVGVAVTGALALGAKFKAGASLKMTASLSAALDAGLRGSGIPATSQAAVKSELTDKLKPALGSQLDSAFGPDPGFQHASGKPVLTSRVRHQRVGAWHAQVEIELGEDDEVPTGPFRFEIEGIEHRGTIIPGRAGTYGSRTKVKLVGGNGGLSTELEVRNYSGPVKIRTVVDDLMRDSGEELSHDADLSLLNKRITNWQRSKAPTSHSLTRVLDQAGANWRVLVDGTIWIGVDKFPEVETTGEVVDEDWGSGGFTIKPDLHDLTPGISFRGQRIEYVEHTAGPEGLRTNLQANSVRSAMDLFLQKIRNEMDYSKSWHCEVKSQNADGTLEVVIDDDKMKGRGVGKVKIRPGIPGTKIKVPHGARGCVAFDAGNPSEPYMASWDAGTKFTSIDIG